MCRDAAFFFGWGTPASPLRTGPSAVTLRGVKAVRFFEEWIRSFLFTALPVLACLFFAGCGTSIDTPFGRSPTDSVDFGNPPGNGGGASQPKPPADAPRQTRYCFLEPDGEYTRSITMDRGHDDARDIDWSQGGTCLYRPLHEAWSLLRNQPLMVWGGVTRSNSIERTDLPEGVLHFFEVKYFVDNPFPAPDVDWTMHWFHSIPEGESAEAPSQVLVNYGKVRGTSFIRKWTGSIVLEAILPGVTSIALRDEIDATQTDAKDSEDGLRDIIRKLQDGH